MTDIKPCPFCGDTYAVIYTTLEDGYHAECLECHAKTDWFSTKAEAIAAWNTRAYSQELVHALRFYYEEDVRSVEEGILETVEHRPAARALRKIGELK